MELEHISSFTHFLVCLRPNLKDSSYKTIEIDDSIPGIVQL